MPGVEEMHTSEERFWMVWRSGGNLPTKRHFTYEAAVEEARRLVNECPAARFWVLEAVGYAQIQPAPVMFKHFPRST